ncbi:MAG: lysophospholipid acyltransferase family protein [Chitinophagia bacterium]|nr:lipid A biosynthesis acyltransferase [Chitinophagia bacterium]
MYYFYYSLLFLLSLLPDRLLYLIGDGFYLFVYYIVGYRKKVVFSNLLIAFPDKTPDERTRIAKEFYHQFINTMIETILLISMSNRRFDKRVTSNAEVLNKYINSGKNVQLHTAHFFNWEMINLGVARKSLFPFVGIYMSFTNKSFDRIMFQMRKRFNTILIPASDFKDRFHEYVKGKYALGLVADQNPARIDKAYWLSFFNKITAFTSGPERGARANDTVVIFISIQQPKRGFYYLHYELITETPRLLPEGELTKIYVAKLEEAIRNNPSNYLWSHRRWKWEYNPADASKRLIQ